MKNNKTPLIFLAVIIAVYILGGVTSPFGGSSGTIESDTVVQIQETVRIDTVKVNITQTDTLYYPKYRTKYVDRVDTVEVEVLVYQDTVALDPNFSVVYNAHVMGQLKSINFGLIGKYPEVTKTKTVTETITNTVYPDGWFLGVYASPHTVGASLTKIMDRHSFSLGYGVDKSMHVEYAFKIK